MRIWISLNRRIVDFIENANSHNQTARNHSTESGPWILHEFISADVRFTTVWSATEPYTYTASSRNMQKDLRRIRFRFSRAEVPFGEIGQYFLIGRLRARPFFDGSTRFLYEIYICMWDEKPCGCVEPPLSAVSFQSGFSCLSTGEKKKNAECTCMYALRSHGNERELIRTDTKNKSSHGLFSCLIGRLRRDFKSRMSLSNLEIMLDSHAQLHLYRFSV